MRIRRFMTEKWDRDKNNFHLTVLDESLLSQLSIDCKMDLYTKFIFKDFIQIFRRFFQFNKAGCSVNNLYKRKGSHKVSIELTNDAKETKNISYPFYTFKDVNYCEFMEQIMNGLEIRFYDKDDIIINEMDESLEVLFVEAGRYEVGYAVNNKLSFHATFGVSTIIGGF